MQARKIYYLTVALVTLSVILAQLSFYTIAKGWGEIYPFFTYKLFSQPLGTNHIRHDYRIYSKAVPHTSFIRNKIRDTEKFNSEDYLYTLNYYVEQYLEDSLSRDEIKNKLLIFAREVVPGQAEYKIVRESYDPAELLKQETLYDTTTIIHF